MVLVVVSCPLVGVSVFFSSVFFVRVEKGDDFGSTSVLLVDDDDPAFKEVVLVEDSNGDDEDLYFSTSVSFVRVEKGNDFLVSASSLYDLSSKEAPNDKDPADVGSRGEGNCSLLFTPTIFSMKIMSL